MQARAIATFRTTTDVIILDEQERANPEWSAFMERLRYGYKRVPAGAERDQQLLDDYALLESVLLGHPTCPEDGADFAGKIIITNRNATRVRLNRQQAMDYARKNNKVIVVYECGEDKVSFSKGDGTFPEEKEYVPVSSKSKVLQEMLRRMHDKQCKVASRVDLHLFNPRGDSTVR